jgi:hypothetical protein
LNTEQNSLTMRRGPIVEAGGSSRDVQELFATTPQKYIQDDSAAKRNVTKLI